MKNHLFLGMNFAKRQVNLAEQVRDALIVDVETASPASKAGLQVGDVILEINLRPLIVLNTRWNSAGAPDSSASSCVFGPAAGAVTS